MPLRNADIGIDLRTGAVTEAGFAEGMAIRLIVAATVLLRPVHGRGLSLVCRLGRTLLPSERRFRLTLRDDSIFRVAYCDPYWCMLLEPRFTYELAIHRFVEAMREVDYAFLDCGANQGYWSVLATSAWAGRKPTLAVEAASDTFAHLADNRSLNGDRFAVLNRAVAGASGEKVRIYGHKHEARSIVSEGFGAPSGAADVETLSLDDISKQPSVAGASKFAVKLDVEGVEIAALRTADALLSRDTVVLYEDHGSDRTHAVTDFALKELRMRVFWLGEGGPVEITEAAQLGPIKVARRQGYDLAASRSPFWLSRLDAMVAGSKRGAEVA